MDLGDAFGSLGPNTGSLSLAHGQKGRAVGGCGRGRPFPPWGSGSITPENDKYRDLVHSDQCSYAARPDSTNGGMITQLNSIQLSTSSEHAGCGESDHRASGAL